jgi:RNA polymerase sigma factor (sigma-70 family)
MDQSVTGSTEGDVFRLIEEAKAGDKEALRKLLEHPSVLSRALLICQRIIRYSPKSGYFRDAEDLRQELLCRFWQKFSQFRGENGEASFWSFFVRLAYNIHLTQVRETAREIKQSEEKSLDDLTVALQADQDQLLLIKEVVASLSERERLILQQRVEGKKLVEIADEASLGITKSTVHRTLEKIQNRLIGIVVDRKDKKPPKGAQKKKASRKPSK